MNDYIDIYKISTPLRFYEELVRFLICTNVLVIGPFQCTTYVEPDQNILEYFLHEFEFLTILANGPIILSITHKSCYPFQIYGGIYYIIYSVKQYNTILMYVH